MLLKNTWPNQYRALKSKRVFTWDPGFQKPLDDLEYVDFPLRRTLMQTVAFPGNCLNMYAPGHPGLWLDFKKVQED